MAVALGEAEVDAGDLATCPPTDPRAYEQRPEGRVRVPGVLESFAFTG